MPYSLTPSLPVPVPQVHRLSHGNISGCFNNETQKIVFTANYKEWLYFLQGHSYLRNKWMNEVFFTFKWHVFMQLTKVTYFPGGKFETQHKSNIELCTVLYGSHCRLICFLCVSLQPHGLKPTKLLCPQDSPGKNTGVGCHFLLQGIFRTQGSNMRLLRLLHCRQVLYRLSHQGSPKVAIQFSSVAQLCPTVCDPMNCSTPGLPVHHQLPEFTQTHVHWVGDAIQPSHPLPSPSPPAPNPSQHQGLFQWVNSSLDTHYFF